MKDKYINEGEFYDNSILVDVYKYPKDDGALKNKVEEVKSTIYPQTPFKKSGEDFILYYRHMEQIILNLVASVVSSRPIATSRNRNDYGTDTRYEKVQFSYTYYIKTLDALILLGYIEQKIGVHSLRYNKMTRFWPTEKFIDLLGDTVLKMPLVELDGESIRLRAKTNHKNDKKFASYDDSDHPAIPQFRKDIELINNVNSNADIQLNIKNEVVPHSFLEHIQNGNRTDNLLIVKSHKLSFRITRSLTDNIGDRFAIKPSEYNYKYAYHNLHNETNKNKSQYCFNVIPIDGAVPFTKFSTDREKIANEIDYILHQTVDLSRNRIDNDYYYFNELCIEFLYKSFHRVFNIDFDHGGRFYNYIIQQVPSYLRKYITINGNKTVELDYSGFHLRLLYHLEGDDYQDDPYNKLIDKGQPSKPDISDEFILLPKKSHREAILTKAKIIPILSLLVPFQGFKYLEERDKYKLAQLILINAADKIDEKGKVRKGEDRAIQGIMNGLREAGCVGIGKSDVVGIIDKFKKHHGPIADYLYSGKSGELQNIDSAIINDVMVHFAEQGIPLIPIHDSVIIEEQHEPELRKQMMEQYKKHVGFYPVIDPLDKPKG